MANILQHFHGSDLEKIAAHYNLIPSDIINFSGNVNPLGLSSTIQEELARQIHLIAAYPDRDYLSLRKTLGKYIGAPYEDILVGNGSTELISLFIKVLHPQNALIIGPTYSEYEREIFINDGKSRYFPLLEEDDFKINIENLKQHLSEQTDLLVICNPNNPTSTSIFKKEMREILDFCLEQDVDVVIDETYVEFAEDVHDVSAVSLTPFYQNLFIIRGVSKFYAAPGLRLGYGISGNKALIHKINDLKNPWTINSLAAYAGELMIQDLAYIDKSRHLISTERQRILSILELWPTVKVYPATANFILIKLLTPHNSFDVFEKLIQKNLMIRDASSFPFLSNKFLRFCILCKDDNDLLLDELFRILQDDNTIQE
ncbi:MAG: threonine-phosphate decarboxylase [Firmicutes bacterium HGW-Firmicutes-3]|jgi:threonine-phosphate decarboxylase|nr:MAG: threonine-phosphate decarboxylase [Firmicutes bacterium HGW-Firmicutes-3]